MREATKHNAETQDPPARIPEITKRSQSGITSHPGTSKQTPTTPDRNESGETKQVKQQVRNDLSEKDSRNYGTQRALRVRSVALFQSSTS